jgi:hypothetical protein
MFFPVDQGFPTWDTHTTGLRKSGGTQKVFFCTNKLGSSICYYIKNNCINPHIRI